VHQRDRELHALLVAVRKVLHQLVLALAETEPIEPEPIPIGTVDEERGEASLVLSLKGPNDSAKVALRATRAEGHWAAQECYVVTSDGTRVDLLAQ